jgi:hypothetical protein
MNARLVGAAGSVLLHAALFGTFPITRLAHTELTGGTTRGEDVAMQLLPSENSEGAGIGCPHSYRGVGIISTYAGWVEEVVSGGPADKAGVQIGDKFLNGEMFRRDGYSLGRQLVIKVDRHGVRLDLPVVIGAVCYEEPQTTPHLAERP